MTSTDDALGIAGMLDLSTAEERFRESLPPTPATDAMVRETALEYRRLHALRSLGSTERPEVGTLLDRFLNFAPRLANSIGSVRARYREVFGHGPTYPWNKDIAVLCYGGPQPGSGGASENSAF